MALKEIVIKVDNDKIHLNPKLTVPIQQTNIPIGHMKFRTNKDIFWKVELVAYNEDAKCWKVKVTDYFANDIKNFDRQKSTKEVERIAFEKFDWLKFESHLIHYHKIKMIEVLDNHDADRFFREKPKLKTTPAISIADLQKHKVEINLPQTFQNTTPFVPTEHKPIIETFKVEFSVYFTDAHFMLGYVAFNKHIKEVSSKIHFKIKNEFILAEFDNIKSWFAKILKTRKFKVVASIKTTDGKYTDATATSSQIEMITSELIDSIKYQRTISLTKSPRVNTTDKSLFTAEEIFGDQISEDIEGNVFKQTEQDILRFLVDHHKIRNRKQLEYLSGKQSEKNKLRFTLHPNFGFLFLLEGKENNHFVWELLNTHATYIWCIDKSDREIEFQFKRIEDSVNTIRNSGRENYKRAYRNNHHDSDLAFTVIEHDDIASDFVDDFVKWKHKLNEQLT
ncbi:MAG: hypothetical protein ABI199_06730 [Bacteroidia bacterium]